MSESARVAYSPAEFAELFGKSQTWGYRQIYGGKVNAITEYGRIMIPAKEVERVLEKAGIYNGREKPKGAKAREKSLSLEQKSILERFIRLRREPQNRGKAVKARSTVIAAPGKTSGRNSVLNRIASGWNVKGVRH